VSNTNSMVNPELERMVTVEVKQRMARLALASPAFRLLVQEWEKGPVSDMTLLLVMEHTQAAINNLTELLIKDPRPFKFTFPDTQLTVSLRDKPKEAPATEPEAKVGKYGAVERFADKLRPGEPWFGIRGQDQLAVPAMEAYAKLAAASDRNATFLHSLALLIDHIRDWQAKNQEFVKLPD